MRIFISSVSIFTLLLTFNVHAIDIGDDEMTVDRSDTNDFEEFHSKDDSKTTWSTEGKTTYDEQAAQTATQTTTQSHSGPIIEEEVIGGTSGGYEGQSTTTAPAPAASTTAAATPGSEDYSGQQIGVREAYKLSMDPTLSNVPTLFEAIHSLHVQLSGYCPKGWKKKEEWHEPEDNYYYIYYKVNCE